jgi:hypothetical protein
VDSTIFCHQVDRTNERERERESQELLHSFIRSFIHSFLAPSGFEQSRKSQIDEREQPGVLLEMHHLFFSKYRNRQLIQSTETTNHIGASDTEL